MWFLIKNHNCQTLTFQWQGLNNFMCITFKICFPPASVFWILKSNSMEKSRFLTLVHKYIFFFYFFKYIKYKNIYILLYLRLIMEKFKQNVWIFTKKRSYCHLMDIYFIKDLWQKPFSVKQAIFSGAILSSIIL